MRNAFDTIRRDIFFTEDGERIPTQYPLLWQVLALPHPVLLTVFVFSYGFSQACRDVVYPLVLGRCFGDRYLGEIYGAMTLTLLPGGALGPIFAGALYDVNPLDQPGVELGKRLIYGLMGRAGSDRPEILEVDERWTV